MKFEIDTTASRGEDMNYYQYVESGKIVTRDELWDFWSRLNPMHAHDPVEFEMSLSADIGNGVLREVTDKDKQIADMSRELKDYTRANHISASFAILEGYAEAFYNAGYRKIYDDHERQCTCYALGCQMAEELEKKVAREILDEIRAIIRADGAVNLSSTIILAHISNYLIATAKKYTENKGE